MSIKFWDKLFNFSNNIYMLWSHLLYVTNNIYMLVFKQHIYVGNLFGICYTILKHHTYGICSPWHIFFKKYRNMLTCFLQYALTRVITWHDIQLDSIERAYMVWYDLSRRDQVWTASSWPGETHCQSQSSVMATWHTGVAGGTHIAVAHSVRRHRCEATLTQQHTILIHPVSVALFENETWRVLLDDIWQKD